MVPPLPQVWRHYIPHAFLLACKWSIVQGRERYPFAISRDGGRFTLPQQCTSCEGCAWMAVPMMHLAPEVYSSFELPLSHTQTTACELPVTAVQRLQPSTCGPSCMCPTFEIYTTLAVWSVATTCFWKNAICHPYEEKRLLAFVAMIFVVVLDYTNYTTENICKLKCLCHEEGEQRGLLLHTCPPIYIHFKIQIHPIRMMTLHCFCNTFDLHSTF